MVKDYAAMANAVRGLAIDMVSQANSGHPGLPLGFADVATVLFADFLNFNPVDPKWFNRDRFVLSAGHGSALLYALLYLNNYPDIDDDDLRQFRQLGSVTAGHPEYGALLGIETTTGPLGQGLATAVGMALAERLLNQRFGSELVEHYTYVAVGDGCLMEGISQEAISLAGLWKLKKLIVLWDSNGITIDGATSLAVAGNMRQRFEAEHWQYLEVDGHDHAAIHAVLQQAQQADRPTVIECHTHIGFGSPKEGSNTIHGSPLKPEELATTKQKLGLPAAAFAVEESVIEAWNEASQHAVAAYQAWQQYLQAHAQDPLVKDLQALIQGEFPENWREAIDQLKQQANEERPELASRQGSQKVLEALTQAIDTMIGGSADLTGSVGTKTAAVNVAAPVSYDNYGGRYINYGIREHAMGSVMNGLALHGFVPYGGTFMVFSDYMRDSIRLAALMQQQVLFILTHDSIAVGEDGPTHQPIEQLVGLRAIPGLNVFRPCDFRETIECYELALDSHAKPSAMILSRQKLPYQAGEFNPEENYSSYGAYVLSDNSVGVAEPAVVLLSSGSEVSIARQVQQLLEERHISSRVVSCPCLELFQKQTASYQEQVLGGESCLRVAIEAATKHSWCGILGRQDLFFGMGSFGASGKAEDVYRHFGLDADTIAAKICQYLH